MKILISPSKNMKVSNVKGNINASENLELLNILKSLSWEEIRDEMKVNEKIAKLNYERYQSFAPVSQAIFTYDGLQFKQLDLGNYNDSDFKYLSDNVRIVSALYGLVNPIENIGYYRLEMQSAIRVEEKAISEYWKARISETLQSDVIVSLLSKEYEQVLDSNLNLVRIHFEIEQDGIFKTAKSIKICRGKFLNQCIINSVKTLGELKNIEFDGYKFHDKSTKNDFYYVKKA